ncbi:MAG: phytanoyl-CoA dioxygenase family protein [Ilumatobacteraceae bacterium]
MLTSQQLGQYAADGYCLIKGFFDMPEVTSFRDRARLDLQSEIELGEMMEKGDKEGRRTLLKLWNEAGDDLYGYVARDQRLVDTSVDIIGRATYLYSHKMTMKEPFKGGAWEWHQDFGYWYQNKCLAPEMLSIWIALDPSLKENGCLQVLSGSHHLGRIDHLRVNDQTVVDEEYLEAALKRFDRVYVEMDPGDALVFHCNLLHRSDANTSAMQRWGYIASYNAVGNEPFRDVREYGRYHELVPLRAGTFVSATAEI